MPWNNTRVLHRAAVKAICPGSQGTVLSVRQPGEPHTNPWMGDIWAQMGSQSESVQSVCKFKVI